MNIPKQYLELVGTKQILSGGLFSFNRSEPAQEYDILDIRWGSGQVVNVKELRETGKSSYTHPTFQLLVKREGMKKSRWTKGFPIREINLNDNSEKNI